MASIKAVQAEIERLRECGSIATKVSMNIADLSDEQRNKIEELLGVSAEALNTTFIAGARYFNDRVMALEEKLDKVDIEI